MHFPGKFVFKNLKTRISTFKTQVLPESTFCTLEIHPSTALSDMLQQLNEQVQNRWASSAGEFVPVSVQDVVGGIRKFKLSGNGDQSCGDFLASPTVSDVCAALGLLVSKVLYAMYIWSGSWCQ